MELRYDFKTCVENSERVAWRIDDFFREGQGFDWSRPFLPEALLPTAGLAFLQPDERRALNQIGAKAYMNLFGFVEVYIEAMVIEHSQAALFGDRDEMRALARFADEEVKHQQLFSRYCASFDREFGAPCAVLDNAAEVAQVILAKSPLCVLLTTLHIEFMTQQHYTESVRSTTEPLDATNVEVLRRHWLEESQHARIDALLLRRLASLATPEALAAAHAEYLDVLSAFDGLLGAQAALDRKNLEGKIGRALSDEEGRALVQSQHRGYRKTFLHCGLTNPHVLEELEAFWSAALPAHRARAEAVLQ